MGMRIKTTSRLMEKARRNAIVSIARILNKKEFYGMEFNGEFKTCIEGNDLDCYDVRVNRVFLKGKCVMVEYDMLVDEECFEPEELDDFKGFKQPINILTSATILTIWENMVGLD